MKTGIFIGGILSIIFLCLSQSQAYQINILQENYSCNASAGARVDDFYFSQYNRSGDGIYNVSETCSVYYYDGSATPFGANATASIIKNNNPWNLNYTANISGMNSPYHGAYCSSSAIGEVYFSITKETQDIKNSVVASFQILLHSFNWDDPTSQAPSFDFGIYVGGDIFSNDYLFNNLYSLEVNVNEVQKITFLLRGEDTGSFNPGFYNASVELKLSVPPSSPVPLPSAIILLGAGLGRLGLYCRRKRADTN